jgi:hypothetical protein
MRDHLPYGDTLADQATGQEQEAKQVLARLDKLGTGDAEFEELLGTFIGAARARIEFEETAVWPRLRTALNTERAAELGPRSPRARRPLPPSRTRTRRPRPARSRRPGPAVAAADKARDAMTGCGD